MYKLLQRAQIRPFYQRVLSFIKMGWLNGGMKVPRGDGYGAEIHNVLYKEYIGAQGFVSGTMRTHDHDELAALRPVYSAVNC